MDDTFIVLHSDENDYFFRYIIAVYSNIKLTQVDNYYNRLSFLIDLVTIDAERTISVTVFQKYTHTDEYMKFQSNHSLHKKIVLDKSLIHRADYPVSMPDGMLSDQKHLRQCVNQCGYWNIITINKADEYDDRC